MRLKLARGTPERLATLQPAYFALVMATGIVSIALHLHGWTTPGLILLWLNIAQFAALALLFALRAGLHSEEFVSDLSSHARGMGFFTWVAAPGILGVQMIVQLDRPPLAMAFWFICLTAWLVTTYGVLAAIMVRQDKPGLADGLNGGWLVSVVATQSLSMLTALLAGAGAFGAATEWLLFCALALWFGGGVLYLWVMALIFLRYTFLRMRPDDLTPPYWISMGAVAISTLAGATLIQQADLSPLIADLLDFLKGFSLLFWAVGTWWIPMLLVLGFWRYVLHNVPLSYDSLYWGGVFPVGMYSVCTYRLGQALPATFLAPVASISALLAAIAWATTFIAMLDSLLRKRGPLDAGTRQDASASRIPVETHKETSL